MIHTSISKQQEGVPSHLLPAVAQSKAAATKEEKKNQLKVHTYKLIPFALLLVFVIASTGTQGTG